MVTYPEADSARSECETSAFPVLVLNFGSGIHSLVNRGVDDVERSTLLPRPLATDDLHSPSALPLPSLPLTNDGRATLAPPL
jgi:hypothetical protein